MSYIAVVRFENGRLLPIVDGDSEIQFVTEWKTEREAEQAMEHHILAPMGIQIVEI